MNDQQNGQHNGHQDDEQVDPIGARSIVAGADAICPAGDQVLTEELLAALRRYGLANEPPKLDEPPHRPTATHPPCKKCTAISECVLRAAWDHEIGMIGLGGT